VDGIPETLIRSLRRDGIVRGKTLAYDKARGDALLLKKLEPGAGVNPDLSCKTQDVREADSAREIYPRSDAENLKTQPTVGAQIQN
jgi:hypothetical protein